MVLLCRTIPAKSLQYIFLNYEMLIGDVASVSELCDYVSLLINYFKFYGFHFPDIRFSLYSHVAHFEYMVSHSLQPTFPLRRRLWTKIVVSSSRKRFSL